MLGEKAMVQKRCFYEWSVRIPLIVNFPDQRYAGRQLTTPVSLLDLLPTLLDLAGVPEADRLPLDGRTLLPLFNGSEEPERTVLAEYHVEKVKGPAFMARRGRYKYIHIYEHGSQLFDLENDPGEWHNLKESTP
jgi:choline-sulfatase